MAREKGEIEKELADDLERATAEFMRVHECAMEVIRDGPSGLPFAGSVPLAGR